MEKQPKSKKRENPVEKAIRFHNNFLNILKKLKNKKTRKQNKKSLSKK
jgi:hypothetical protein